MLRSTHPNPQKYRQFNEEKSPLECSFVATFIGGNVTHILLKQ